MASAVSELLATLRRFIKKPSKKIATAWSAMIGQIAIVWPVEMVYKDKKIIGKHIGDTNLGTMFLLDKQNSQTNLVLKNWRNLSKQIYQATI